MEREDCRLSVDKAIRDHYDIIIDFRDNLIEDDGDPKDIASALTATTIIIRDIVKVQTQLYNAENFALLQQTIVNVLKEEDRELAERIIAAYTADLERKYAEAL